MPLDYKASQIRTHKLIATGSSNYPKLLLYADSAASDQYGNISQTWKTGSDSWLYVSGGINSTDKVLFGGDVTISGTFRVNPQSVETLINAKVDLVDQNECRVGIKTNLPATTLHVGGDNDPGFIVDTGAIINFGRNLADSATLLVQGKAGGDHGLLVVSASCDRVSIGKHHPNAKLDILGDEIITGSLYASTRVHSPELTGSLTKLVNGNDYLVAGDGISLTVSSTGSILIESTGASALPGGLDTFIQFNDAGVLGGQEEFTFDKSTNELFLSGTLLISGSSNFGETIDDTFKLIARLDSNIVPTQDAIYTLGTPDLRFAHVYTGDLHLRNERGNWTILEEVDYLCVINNTTGKKYKMMLSPIDD